MRRMATVILLLIQLTAAYALPSYVRTFGDPTAQAVVYLHGGPGYNCANFEGTTAAKLARSGFYVLVYDRSGEGRSLSNNAPYTFDAALKELDDLCLAYNITNPILIGHSFGGMLGILYTDRYPDKVKKLILVSASTDLQDNFRNIIARSKALYQAKGDTTNLRYIALLEKLDTASIQYSTFCFMHALQNGFYTPTNASEAAEQTYTAFAADSLRPYAMKMEYEAPAGYWKNEHYTIINLDLPLRRIAKKKNKLYGIYGKDDGLFSEAQIKQLKQIAGSKHILYLEHCSHSVFMDQQDTFIHAIKDWNQ